MRTHSRGVQVSSSRLHDRQESNFFLPSACKHRSATFLSHRCPRSHSQILTTFQPCFLSVAVTSKSRLALRASFSFHQDARVAGTGACFGLGQPCQKHPSTNTATRSGQKMKSGFPNTFCRRRQPVIRYRRKIAIKRTSVPRFPLPRIAAMTALRFSAVNTSGISHGSAVDGDYLSR